MERPFDYPGSTSDVAYIEPSQLRKVHDHHIFDEDGESCAHWIIAAVPSWWTDEDIGDVVHDRWSEERCSHEHDCCGHWYARRAAWSKHPAIMPDGDQCIIISQRSTLNI